MFEKIPFLSFKTHKTKYEKMELLQISKQNGFLLLYNTFEH